MYESDICRRAGSTRHLTPPPGAIAGDGGARIDMEVSARSDPHLNFGKPLETAGRKARGLRHLDRELSGVLCRPSR